MLNRLLGVGYRFSRSRSAQPDERDSSSAWSPPAGAGTGHPAGCGARRSQLLPDKPGRSRPRRPVVGPQAIPRRRRSNTASVCAPSPSVDHFSWSRHPNVPPSGGRFRLDTAGRSRRAAPHRTHPRCCGTTRTGRLSQRRSPGTTRTAPSCLAAARCPCHRRRWAQRAGSPLRASRRIGSRLMRPVPGVMGHGTPAFATAIQLPGGDNRTRSSIAGSGQRARRAPAGSGLAPI
ncbi:hypothetical protein ABIB25_000021 [Nakamurella sp. UYEF19]